MFELFVLAQWKILFFEIFCVGAMEITSFEIFCVGATEKSRFLKRNCKHEAKSYENPANISQNW